MKKVLPVGLICHPAIQWLIVGEKPVYQYIQSYIEERAPSDTVSVAGPPTREAAEAIRKGGDVALPTVTLSLSRTFDDERGLAVRVVASDNDISTIQGWMLRAQRPQGMRLS